MRALLGILLLMLAAATTAQTGKPAAEGPPAVFVNHVFFVPDEDTYRAIEQAKWLFEEFAPGEVRTTVRSDMTYSGIYFYGRHSYFEFLRPGTVMPEGASAVAFGVERPEDLTRLAQHLKAEGIETQQFPQTREGKDGAQVPWFQMIMGPMEPGRLGVWTMAYEPGFLPAWFPEAGGPTQGTARADILARYTAKVVPGREPESFLLADVIELELHLPELVRLQWECRSLGFRTTVVSNWAMCTGPGLLIRAQESNEKGPMLRAITLRLNRAKEGQQEYRLGQTVLRFEGNRARWEFGSGINTAGGPDST